MEKLKKDGRMEEGRKDDGGVMEGWRSDGEDGGVMEEMEE